MAGQHYCLRWNNYQSNMTSVFHHLLRTEAFVDVTLACNDLSLKAHKVVLSACSSYFQKLLLENPCKHPTIIMPQDVCFSDLKFIIEFVYRGEIDVSQAELQSLLKTADQLKIKGLCEMPEAKENSAMNHCGSNDQDPHSVLSRRTFTKLRQLSGSKRPRGPDGVRRAIFNDDGDVDLPDFARDRGFNTVATCTEEDHSDTPVVLHEQNHHQHNQHNFKRQVVGNGPAPITTPLLISLDSHSMTHQTSNEVDLLPEPQPLAPAATLVENLDINECSAHDRNQLQENSRSSLHTQRELENSIVKVKFETLRAMEQADAIDIDDDTDDHDMDDRVDDEDHDHAMHTMMVTPELLGLMPNSSIHSDMNGDPSKAGIPKSWTQEDMELALDALRNHNMSLTKASATYGIPSTTLWQRAHRLGITTPKKEGPAKSWTEDILNTALDALRTGTISANKASKAYGIPSSTLYKIARREGIRLAAPFNAAPTTWSPDDLERALEAIRSGVTTVQRASTEFGIPTGTLYGRCKREGIELSRSNPTPWSEGAMGEALEAVRVGQMSINQAAIHYNLPYSSLYGRFKRGKYEAEGHPPGEDINSDTSPPPQIMVVQYQHHNQLQAQQQHATMYEQHAS